MKNSLEKETTLEEEEEEDIDDLLEDYELHRGRRHNIHHIIKEEERQGRKSDAYSIPEVFSLQKGDTSQQVGNGNLSFKEVNIDYNLVGTTDRTKFSKTSLDTDESPRKDNRLNTLNLASNFHQQSSNEKSSPNRRRSFEKPKNSTSGSFHSSKGEHSDSDRGDRSGKNFKSFAGSSYEANWMHFGGDVSYRLPRKGSFEADIRKGTKEGSNLVYDYILHRSEISSGFGAKQKGKPLISSYLGKEFYYKH